MAFNVDFSQPLWETETFKNPYRANTKVDQDLVDAYYKLYKKKQELPIDAKRTNLSRVLDAISTPLYMSAGIVKGMVDPNATVMQGITRGISAGNPFGAGYAKGRTTYSDVFESAGWKPDTTMGKIAKGTLGFIGDVLLDPTTYLSGGLSAIVRGSGRVEAKALANLTSKVGSDVFDSTLKQTIEKGINPDLAERFAVSKAQKAMENATSKTGLDITSAEAIIRKQNDVRGITMSDAEITKDAERFANEYNRVAGLKSGNSDVTLSLANAPFGKKIFRGLADKSVTLAKAGSLERFGDATLAPVYSKIRDSIYGTKLGELFSPTTPLYRISKEDPAKLYDFMKFVDTTRGLKGDMIASEKAIRDKASALLNLSPAESKQVMEMMQDKTIFGKVAQTVKFLDTEEAKTYRSRVVKLQQDTQSTIDELTQNKSDIEKLKLANDEGLVDARVAHQALTDEYRQNLMNLKTDTVTNHKQIQDLTAKYEDEYKALQEEMNKPLDSMYTQDTIQPEFLTAQYDNYVKGVEARKSAKDATVKANDNAESKAIQDVSKVEIDDRVYRVLDKNGYVAYKSPKAIEEFSNKYPTWQKVVTNKPQEIDYATGEILKDVTSETRFYPPQEVLQKAKSARKTKMPNVPQEVKRTDMIEQISQYVYGHPDMISPTIWDSNLKPIMKMMKDGKSKDEIASFMEKHADAYSGRAQTIYPWLADKLGYKTWDEAYVQPMKEIYDRAQKAGGILSTDEGKILKLQQLNLQRQYWLNTFRNARTMQDVTNIMTEEANKELEKIWSETKDIYNSTSSRFTPDIERKRADFVNSDSSVEKYKTDYTDKVPLDVPIAKSQKNEFFNRVIDMMYFKTKAGRDASGKVVNILSDVKQITPGHIRYANSVVAEVEPLLKNFFKKDYGSLSPRQQDYLFSLAIKNANARVEGSKLVGAIPETDMKAIVKEAQRRLETEHVDAVVKEVKMGSEVTVVKGDETHVGTIQDIKQGESGNTTYTILKDDGTSLNVAPGDVKQINVNNAKLTTADLITKSDTTKDFVIRQTELTKLIDENKVALKSFDEQYFTSYHKMLDDFTARDAELTTRIKTLEEESAKIAESFKAGNFAKIDELAPKLAHMEEVLASDDAFETYMRTWIGDGKVNEIIAQSNPQMGKIMLDANTSADEKVINAVKFLRDEFIRMGESEVGIGKLKPEQFENLMYDYLPHILTPDGAKHFAKNDVFKKIPKFGDNLGYGRKFNPFAKTRQIKVLPDGNGGWIENPTVEQINEFFKPMLNGKNAMSEDIADIFVTRALKNTELIYDHKYMQTMLDTFGKDYTGKMEKGYNIVMNYGKMKEVSADVARMNVDMDMSQTISEYMKENNIAIGIRNEVISSMPNANRLEVKREINNRISKWVEDFSNQTFPDEVRNQMYQDYVQRVSKGSLDDLAVPMVEFDTKQADDLTQMFDTNMTAYTDHIRGKLIKLEESVHYETQGTHLDEKVLNHIKEMSLSDMKTQIEESMKHVDEVDAVRYQRLFNKVDKAEQINPVQIKQVNSAIVQKANQARKLQIAKDNSRFLQLYDKFTHLIKLNQTTVLPAFHMRNKLSNTYLNWLAVGADAVNIDFQKQAFIAMKNKGKSEGLLKITHEDGTVSEMPWNEVYNTAMKWGVIDEGFFAKDLGTETLSTGMLGNLPAKFDPTDTKNFLPYQKGSEFGGLIENQDRLIHFASQLSRGMSVEDASKSVDKYLFDYSDLTAFEKNVMKRIIPYYTWLRKNSALQLQTLLENPKKFLYVSKVIGGVEGMTNEEDRINKGFVNDFALDWVQTPFTVTNPQGKQEPVLWNPNLPFMDLSRIPDVTRPLDSLKQLFTQTNPLIKTPIEEVINRNVFFDSPIVGQTYNRHTKEYEPESQLNRLDHVASQLGAYGIATGLATKQGADLGLHILNNTTGVKMLSYDYETYKAMKIQEILDKIDKGELHYKSSKPKEGESKENQDAGEFGKMSPEEFIDSFNKMFKE